jgi:hypothetical protein
VDAQAEQEASVRQLSSAFPTLAFRQGIERCARRVVICPHADAGSFGRDCPVSLFSKGKDVPARHYLTALPEDVWDGGDNSSIIIHLGIGWA